MDTSDQPVVAAACSIVIFFMVIASTASLCITKRRRNKSSNPEPKSTPPPVIVIDEGYDLAKHFSMTEIAAATNNFSPKLCIGYGSFSSVYKGRLHNNNQVAIKRLDRDYNFSVLREFRAEVEVLCNLQHQNVVPLVGYCVSGGDRFLVYKFMENGSLHNWLYHNDRLHQGRSLSWKTRVKILKDVAQGLWYMHDGLKAPLIHRDVKPSNILLDKDFNARLTDFGLARTVDTGRSHVSTESVGSLGYMPPESEGFGFATIKTDVYGFGVSMLEIMTGKSPCRLVEAGKVGKMRLIEWVMSMVAKNQYMEMLDPSIQWKGLAKAQVEECFRICVLCLSVPSKERPTMGQVVHVLNQIQSS